jgi:hypothetical protein
LTTKEVLALTTSQTRAFSTNQVIALTTTAIAAINMTSSPISAFTLAQQNALTTAQNNVYLNANYVSPIALALTDNGVNTQSISLGVQFDLSNTGNAINTGWVAQGTGLLVNLADLGSNSNVTNGSELFGNATLLSNGQVATTGYQALAEMDTNGDGKITSADKGFANLAVWVNASDSSAPQELLTLSQLGIASLNLNATASTDTSNGNLVGLISSYTLSNGQTYEMADLFFAVNALQAGSSGLTASQVNNLVTAAEIFRVVVASTVKS